VADGFKRLATEGPAGALAVWLRQSRASGETEAAQYLSDLKKFEANLGSCTGFDMIKLYPLGRQSTVVAASAHYRYGSVFFRFLIFQDSTGQQYVNSLAYSADPLKVFPPELSVLREFSAGGR
jgi:hypothetical protein